MGKHFPEPFQRFAGVGETVETVARRLKNVPNTQLKQGVNEKSLCEKLVGVRVISKRSDC